MQIYSDILENSPYRETMKKNPSLAAVCFLLGAGGNLPDDLLTKTEDANIIIEALKHSDIIEMLKDYVHTYCSSFDDIEYPSWLTTCSKGSNNSKLLFNTLLFLFQILELAYSYGSLPSSRRF